MEDAAAAAAWDISTIGHFKRQPNFCYTLSIRLHSLRLSIQLNRDSGFLLESWVPSRHRLIQGPRWTSLNPESLVDIAEPRVPGGHR